MKQIKCKVLSEFDGTINGHHISDEELYYTMSHTLAMITGTLRQIKIKKKTICRRYHYRYERITCNR